MKRSKEPPKLQNQSTLPESLEDAHELIAVLRQTLEDSGRKSAKTFARIAHDLNNVLMGPMGYVDLARRTARDAETAKYLRMAASTLRTAQGLLKDVQLSIANGQGKLEPRLHAFCLEDVITEIKHCYLPMAADKDLSFWIDIKPSCPEYVIGDASMFSRIIDNLISNAVKYTRCGSVGLVIGNERSWLHIQVTDTGIGIAEDDQTRIFRTFQRASTDILPDVEGFGIGLSCVSDLVSLLNGDLDVQSKVGSGSTFTVRLPFPPAEAK